VTVNLAPADLRKGGSAFDLPMAPGSAGRQGTFFGKGLDSHVFRGALSLDGSIRSVRGAFSAALAAQERGFKTWWCWKQFETRRWSKGYACSECRPGCVPVVAAPQNLLPFSMTECAGMDVHYARGPWCDAPKRRSPPRPLRSPLSAPMGLPSGNPAASVRSSRRGKKQTILALSERIVMKGIDRVGWYGEYDRLIDSRAAPMVPIAPVLVLFPRERKQRKRPKFPG
jgi:Subunit ChlI of Mg-chelatase